MNNEIEIVQGLDPGDLIVCEWCDASVGKSRSNGLAIDVPVQSWGIYVGLFGEKIKHIVLAQNSFRYSDGMYDLDYTAIPVGWTTSVKILSKEHIPKSDCGNLVNSFLLGGHTGGNRMRTARTAQKRLRTHDRKYY